jgi:hypothetical protein
MDRGVHLFAPMHGSSSFVRLGWTCALLAMGCGGVAFEAPSSQSTLDASVEASAGDARTDAGDVADVAVADAVADAAAIARQPTCRSTPSACLPSPSCACVEQRDTQCASPSCTSDGGAVTVTCKL